MTTTPTSPAARAELNGVPHRIRVPAGDGPHPTLIMLHGYQGTENVTWIFAKALGPEWLVASPRAPFEAAPGYTWYLFNEGKSDPLTYAQGMAILEGFIESLKARYAVDEKRLVLLGFSQGAAMAYAYGMSHPVAGIVSLGGFIPSTVKKPYPALNGLPILIVHGSQDTTIAVEIARKNRDALTDAGAEVSFFEEAVGHRVGPGGMRLLTGWLASRT